LYNIQVVVLSLGGPSEALSSSSNRLTLENNSNVFFLIVGNYNFPTVQRHRVKELNLHKLSY